MTTYYVRWAGRERVVEIRRTKGTGADGGLEVLVDGTPHPAEVAAVEPEGLLSLLVDGRSITYSVRFEDSPPFGQTAILGFHDLEVRVPIEDERRHAARLAAGTPAKPSGRVEVRSVMPGVVKELRAAAGSEVEEGQSLLILEAMKMENEIRAPQAGRVEALHVAARQSVEKGALLVTIGPSGGPTAAPSGS
jgi:biotin carboxyl carrier protein